MCRHDDSSLRRVVVMIGAVARGGGSSGGRDVAPKRGNITPHREFRHLTYLFCEGLYFPCLACRRAVVVVVAQPGMPGGRCVVVVVVDSGTWDFGDDRRSEGGIAATEVADATAPVATMRLGI